MVLFARKLSYFVIVSEGGLSTPARSISILWWVPDNN